MPRDFPRDVAIFHNEFVFTTLTPGDVRSHNARPFCHPETKAPCVLFTLDDKMVYQKFYKDHGPLNLAYTFEACSRIHEKLDSELYAGRTFCLYTTTEPRMKSNMMLMTCLYFLIIHNAPPWECYAPIAHMEVMPFRDAGRCAGDHGVSIQDCLYGIHKALELGLLDMSVFDKNFYRYYEQVTHGDLNLMGPFIPFASPIERTWLQASIVAHEARKAKRVPVWPPMIPKAKRVDSAFEGVLEVFTEENVGLVVRLNDELYDKKHFTERGIEHFEMYFDDGSNPSDSIVKEFIALADDFIEGRGKKVAVHCKAGLGRTGVLIGAYFIYKYHFTAQEVIGYMRIVRPGMVVGSQQQYMLRNQMKWVTWAAMDQAAKLAKNLVHEQKPRNPLATPPAEPRTPIPLTTPLTEIMPPDNRIIDRLTSKLQSKTSGGLRSRQSSPDLCAPPAQLKGGDAVGQPRKGAVRLVRGEPHIEIKPEPVNIRIGAPSPVPLVAVPASQTSSSRTSTLSSPVTSASTRGVKRGATRLPIPIMTAERQSPPPAAPRLAVPMQNLHRSSSTSSLGSATSDATRPARKRPAYGLPASSPLSRTGLSSPPPSRESSLEHVLDDDMEVRPLPPSRIPVVPSKPTSKSRKTPSNVPSVGVENTCLDRTHPITVSKTTPSSYLETRRSLLPSMRSIVPRERAVPKALPSVTEMKTRSEVRKKTFTPPRMFGLGHRSAV